MLQQALLNLTINACHAMPDGGTLKIICQPAPRRRVEISVEDTGVGIPPENLGRIFDLYFTTKEKGSGIGLSMVFRIVQLHDGEVEVQSTPGQGLVSGFSSSRRSADIVNVSNVRGDGRYPTKTRNERIHRDLDSESAVLLVMALGKAAACPAARG